jgi:cohesin loading factor subunit SCC2
MISDDDEISGRLLRAQTGLRACKLALQTMTEGSDDRRTCSEDLIQSIVRLVKYVLNSCITPVVESRRTGSSSELFESAARHKSGISDLLRLCGNIFSLVAVLLGKINLTDFTLSPIESISIDMIFIQNAEKEAESVLGIKKVETFRQKAMDVLAQIAAFHPDQRDAIVDEVLLNLERLPAKRTSARHFKSAHDDPIMLVSALFMRIVQAAGSSNSKRIDAPQETPDSDGTDSSEDEESEDELHDPRPKKRKTGKKIAQAPGQIANVLWNESEGIAGRIANTLVARAENVSKSGDKPYRNILDLFMEDLCNVLGSPEWPAATILLYRLLSHMVHISENAKDKSGQAVEMAIATMGNMGCGIIDFTHRLRRLKRGLDIAHSEMSARLIPLADGALARNINRKDVLAENGPYRMVLDSLSTYLHPQGPHLDRNDPYLRSLSGYYVTAWTIAFHESSPENHGVPLTQTMPEMEEQLKNMLLDKNWSAKE